MSRRRARKEAAAHPAPPPAEPRRPISPALLLAVAALVLSVLGGGMIYDRVEPQLGFAKIHEIVGVPFAAILGGAALALESWSPRKRSTSRLSILFVAFLCWCGISALFADNRFAAMSTAALFGGAFAVGAAVRMLASRRDAALAIAVALAGTGSVVAAFGVQEYLIRFRAGNALWRVFTWFVNPDFLAGYLLVILPVTAALLLFAARPAARLLAGLALLLQTACLLLTGSRLGLGSLLVEIALFAFVVWRSGALAHINRRTLLAAGAIVLVTLAVAGGPLTRRLLSSGAESHSAQFRFHTWRGTLRMTAANPVLGTGPGTFETAYPPYQEVGYTQHAHSGFLQIAGETGIPGIALLMAGLTAVVVLGVRRVRPGADPPEASVPDLLLAGCVTGIVGSAAHNFFDSDFYVPAVAFALAGVIGLVLSRLSGPVSADEGDAILPAKGVAVVATLLTLWLLISQGTAAASRIAAHGAAADYQEVRQLTTTGQGSQESVRSLIESAISGYKSARKLQPANPEYSLKLANLYEAIGQDAEAERVYRETADETRLGKAYYRYGRFLTEGRPDEAFSAFRMALSREPNNPQYQLRFAEVEMTRGETGRAESTYRNMIRLYRGVFGAVRPMPELVDWEYGMAYVGLAQIQLSRGERAEAIKSLEDGAGILGEFWRTRNLEIALIRVSREVREETASRYESALTQLVSLYEETGKTEKAAEMRERLAEYRADREKDKAQTP